MEITIRQETPADISAIHTLTKAAFLNAPHATHTEQFTVDALRHAGALSISLVAENGDTIVGHVAISPVSISNGESGWYGLGPISVKPECQQQGIGAQLMVEVLRQLKAMGASGCVLIGDPAYYARFGFKPEKNLVFPYISPEYFHALSFTHRFPQGFVKFHEAFRARS